MKKTNYSMMTRLARLQKRSRLRMLKQSRYGNKNRSRIGLLDRIMWAANNAATQAGALPAA
ncbi:MAG: hypothetical protein EOP50_21310 [Sphingobacteriales bacterium]|nr:MAG: hypothetical protein EOP50_21310 [Sphingobacteriales bacterium]